MEISNNNNNNNNDNEYYNKIPILPIYLQKQIIKLLCNHINESNKLIEPISVDVDYRSNESKIKKLTLKISLVCHLWFTTLCNNLYVSIDFNFTDSYYSINKANNMTMLKLHFNHPENYYYKMIKGVETSITSDYINENIKRLKSLESLVFRNININKSVDNEGIHDLSFMDQIKHQCIQPNNIQVLEVEINQNTTMEKLNQLKSKSSSVFSIIINDCSNKKIIFETFKIWQHTIKQFFVVSHHSLLSPFPWNSLSNLGYLSNVLYFELNGIELRLSNISTIVRSSKNLKHLSFSICFDKLMYYLTKFENYNTNKEEQEKEKQQQHDSNDDDDDDDDNRYNYNPRKCTCNSILFDKSNINYYDNNNNNNNNSFPFNDDDDEDQQDDDDENIELEDEKQGAPIDSSDEEEDEDKEMKIFKNEWFTLSKLLKKSKTLEYLAIHQECRVNGEVLEFTQRNFPKIIFPNAFIKNLGTLISSIPSLKKLSILGVNSPQLFLFISKINKSIKSYCYFESIMDDNYIHENHTPIFQSIIDENPHIDEFKYTKFLFVIEHQTLDQLQNGTLEFNENNLNSILTFKDECLLHFQRNKINNID